MWFIAYKALTDMTFLCEASDRADAIRQASRMFGEEEEGWIATSLTSEQVEELELEE